MTTTHIGLYVPYTSMLNYITNRSSPLYDIEHRRPYELKIIGTLIILFWLFGDLGTTYIALQLGGVETNPIAQHTLTSSGFISLVIMKLGSILAIGLVWGGLQAFLTRFVEFEKVSAINYGFLSTSTICLLSIPALLGVFFTLDNLLAIATLL